MRLNVFRIIVLCVSSLFVFQQNLFAQQISGTVTSKYNGTVVKDATVGLVSKGNLTRTDSLGRFLFSFSNTKSSVKTVFKTNMSEIKGNLIHFVIPTTQLVSIELFKINGQLTKNVLSQQLNAGEYYIDLRNSIQPSSGIYIVKVLLGKDKIFLKVPTVHSFNSIPHNNYLTGSALAKRVLVVDTLVISHPNFLTYKQPVESGIYTYDIALDTIPGKVIYLLNPWAENSPKAVVQGSTSAVQMKQHELKDRDENFCGWYSFFYSGDPANCILHFVNYPESEKFLTAGINAGYDFNLSSFLKDHDTVWISPKPYPFGPSSITNSFPKIHGDCGYKVISAHVRDFKTDGISFFSSVQMNQSIVRGIVQSTLGPTGKPVKSNITPPGATGIKTVNNWFTDNYPDTCIQLKLTKMNNGNLVFNSELEGGFYPLDRFNPYNETFKSSDGKSHNFHFSMDLHAAFIYKKGSRQQFIFRGNDDVWIFINYKLAIDLGNLHWSGSPNATDTINFDDEAQYLGLTDGRVYQIDLFYMSRQPSAPQFFMSAPLWLYFDERLMIIPETNSKNPLIVSYMAKLWMRSSTSAECGVNILSDTVIDAKINATISGPLLSDIEDVPLENGVNYNGITISNFKVTIDYSNITGLESGEYIITITSASNSNLQESIGLLVGKTP